MDMKCTPVVVLHGGPYLSAYEPEMNYGVMSEQLPVFMSEVRDGIPQSLMGIWF